MKPPSPETLNFAERSISADVPTRIAVRLMAGVLGPATPEYRPPARLHVPLSGDANRLVVVVSKLIVLFRVTAGGTRCTVRLSICALLFLEARPTSPSL